MMSPRNLTFNCENFNKMSIEHASSCYLVAGLNAQASLIINVICFDQMAAVMNSELRRSWWGAIYTRPRGILEVLLKKHGYMTAIMVSFLFYNALGYSQMHSPCLKFSNWTFKPFINV